MSRSSLSTRVRKIESLTRTFDRKARAHQVVIAPAELQELATALKELGEQLLVFEDGHAHRVSEDERFKRVLKILARS